MKIEKITWRDSFGVGHAWEKVADMKRNMIDFQCISIGYVVYEEADWILIVPHWHKEYKIDEHVCTSEAGMGDIWIPTGAITDRIALEEIKAPGVTERQD